MTTPTPAREAARDVTEELFSSGGPRWPRADRLIQRIDQGNRDLGGWSRGPVTDRIEAALLAFAAARVAEERERCARTVEKLYRTEAAGIDDGWITPSVRSRVRKRDAAAIRAGETEAPA